MKISSLVRDLLRYSWIASVISMLYALFFIFTFSVKHTNLVAGSIIYSIFVGARFFVQSLIDIFVLVEINKRMPLASPNTKRITRFSVGYLLAFIFFFCTAPLEHYLSPGVRSLTLLEDLPSILLQALINNGLVIIVHNLVILRNEKMNAELENARLRTANLESTNLLLKQQIHPHFLFNALSMLKSLYKTNTRAGEEYLTHLVNFLRASLAEPQSRVSRLTDEIKFCNDYLEMQKIRFEDALNCSIHIPEQVLLKGSVPPFSIQSLIENAIKHNEVTEASPLTIRVYYDDDRITVENNLQPRTHVDSPSGKGLINLVERYKILSGEEVVIRQDSSTFSVTIKVLVNENSDHRR